MIAFTAVVENEGTGYARIAENLLNGRGYVGLRPGSQLMFPPLFPLLIAAVSLVTDQTDVAGRLVSMVFGTALVLVVFLIAERIHGPKVALVTASLTALHPWLIGMSATVYSEATYVTLLMTGVYWVLRTTEPRTWLHAVLAGSCFGLAYLTRPEAFIFPFLAGAFIIATNVGMRGPAVLRSCALLGSFLLLAAPYIAFLTYHTGEVRIEGKSPINYQIGQRMLAGMNYAEAAYGLGTDLTPEGVYLRSYVSVIRSTHLGARELIRYARASARTNSRWVLHTLLVGPYFGAPILPCLAILGLFSKPWRRARIVSESFLLLTFVGIGLALVSVQFRYPRFLYSLLPILIIWGSRGIVEVSRWTPIAVAGVGCTWSRRNVCTTATGWTLAAVVVVIALQGCWSEPDLAQGWSAERPAKVAGEWLKRTVPGPKRIMDSSGLISFYAGATLVDLPYADSPLALKYIESQHPDLIVIRSAYLNRPYLSQWLEAGIPDGRATLIYRTEDDAAGSILIFRWNGAK